MYGMKVSSNKLDCCEVCILNRKRVAYSILICRAVGRGEGYGGAKNRHLEFLNLSPQGLISSIHKIDIDFIQLFIFDGL